MDVETPAGSEIELEEVARAPVEDDDTSRNENFEDVFPSSTSSEGESPSQNFSSNQEAIPSSSSEEAIQSSSSSEAIQSSSSSEIESSSSSEEPSKSASQDETC